jgi:hypothetical protein
MSSMRTRKQIGTKYALSAFHCRKSILFLQSVAEKLQFICTECFRTSAFDGMRHNQARCLT